MWIQWHRATLASRRHARLSRALLSSLEFVVEIEGVVDDHNSEVDTILAVHAGLESDSPLEGQMAGLRRRLVDRKWLEPLQGRSNVLASPPDTPNNVLIVSGHHGVVKIEPNRVILDSCGGYDDRPLGAGFPERLLVEGGDALSRRFVMLDYDNRRLFAG